jgi:hypothetical protein
VTVVAALQLGGCASLKFYPDKDMKRSEVGLKSYYAKPYVLVARDGTQKVTSVNIVYLPDLANPVYAKARSGYGSSNLTLAFSNGMITNFGQQVDTKIPESVTSLGGLVTALATSDKLGAEADKLRRESADFGKFAPTLRAVADDLQRLAGPPGVAAMTGPQKRIILTNINELRKLADAFDAPGAAAQEAALVGALDGIIKALSAVKAGSDQLSDGDRAIWTRYQASLADLARVLEAVKPKASAAPTPAALSLYEVVMDTSGTRLVEVRLQDPVTSP